MQDDEVTEEETPGNPDHTPPGQDKPDNDLPDPQPGDPGVFDSDVPTSPNAHNTPGFEPSEGLPHDTNPVHYENETYEDYVARVPEGTVPASEAEWANAEVVPAPETDDTEVDGEDDDTDVDDEDDDDEE